MSDRLYSFACKMGMELVSLDIDENKLIIKNNSFNHIINYNQIRSISFNEKKNNKLEIGVGDDRFSLNVLTEEQSFSEAFDFINTNIKNSVNTNENVTFSNSFNSLSNFKTNVKEDVTILNFLSNNTIYKKERNLLNNLEIKIESNCVVEDNYFSIDNSFFTQEIPYSLIKNVILNENNSITSSSNEKLTLELLLNNNQRITLYFDESNKSDRFQLYNLIQPKIQNAQPIFYDTINNEDHRFKDIKSKQDLNEENISYNPYVTKTDENINQNNIKSHNLLNFLNKRNVIILLILFLIILGVITLGHGNKLSGDEEKKVFYDGIKEVSDIENKTDTSSNFIENNNVNNQEIKDYCMDKLNTTNIELLKLYDLKNKMSNESYTEYIDIQINRLTNEEALIGDTMIKLNIQTENLTIDYPVSTNMSDYADIINYTALVNKQKREAESFLNIHTDMRDRFNELEIDNDFLYETEEVNIQDKIV